jgi:Primase C terminal 2 (PriCT-2)/RepB DNA-primase from phage plasmid
LPFLSSCRLETSPGNFQDFFVFPRPQTFAAAKPVLRALNRLTGGDAAEQDTSHIWRIAGTLNWPTEAKIARGRPPLPFLVRWDRFPGECVDPATILAAAPAEPPRVPRVVKAVTYSDFESRKLQSALAALDPDVLPTVAKPGSLYDYWLYAGMAIHALGWGDKGLAIFDAWSQRSKHYDGEEVEAKFDSFDADRAGDRKITVASIFHWAKGEGVLLLKRRKPRHFFKKKGVRRHAR